MTTLLLHVHYWEGLTVGAARMCSMTDDTAQLLKCNPVSVIAMLLGMKVTTRP
jgi:hypothetical protein